MLHFMIVTLTLLLLRAALRKQANTGRAAACVAMLLIARSLQARHSHRGASLPNGEDRQTSTAFAS